MEALEFDANDGLYENETLETGDASATLIKVSITQTSSRCPIQSAAQTQGLWRAIPREQEEGASQIGSRAALARTSASGFRKGR